MSGATKRFVSWDEVKIAALCMKLGIGDAQEAGAIQDRATPRVYGVPRGGHYIAAMLATTGGGCDVVGDPADADVIVDDIIDSGRTRDLWKQRFPDKLFLAAFEAKGEWLVFPWEVGEEDEGGERNVVRLLQAIGEDPERDGLRATPGRYVRALRDLTCGYRDDPAKILATSFAEHHDEMIVLRDIPFWSLCEHHVLPFHGVAHVGYIPAPESGRIVGLSKLARLVECFARRLQVQERLTSQVATAIMDHVGASGAACIVEGTHLCMAMRGVQKEGVMTTSSLLGIMREPGVRGEFLRLIGK